MFEQDDDQIDGCDAVLDGADALGDDELDGFVLFADIDPGDAEAVAARAAEWAEVLG